VSFYWAEAADAPGGSVPVELTEPVTPHLRCMSGTNGRSPRCAALQGTVGEAVSCVIYPLRSSTCREFDAWLADGSPDPRCQEARQRWRLPPLAPRST
jgi:Fe-S-cluster containining protein